MQTWTQAIGPADSLTETRYIQFRLWVWQVARILSRVVRYRELYLDPSSDGDSLAPLDPQTWRIWIPLEHRWARALLGLPDYCPEDTYGHSILGCHCNSLLRRHRPPDCHLTSEMCFPASAPRQGRATTPSLEDVVEEVEGGDGNGHNGNGHHGPRS